MPILIEIETPAGNRSAYAIKGSWRTFKDQVLERDPENFIESQDFRHGHQVLIGTDANNQLKYAREISAAELEQMEKEAKEEQARRRAMRGGGRISAPQGIMPLMPGTKKRN